MNALFPYLTVTIALFVQITISPYLKVDLVHPDFVLIVTLSWVILRGLDEGVFIAIFAGIGLDIFSGASFGIFSLSIGLTALLTNLVHDRVFGTNNLILPAALILPATVFFIGFAAFLLIQLGHPMSWDTLLTNIILPVALLNTAVMVPVFFTLYIFNRLLTPSEALTW
ncbi:rod shape-determining protein MreD [Anaerolineales bacterium HSG6]|nr:rod shape-determining protein MreD [Anaerolineales bacterium HSG6]MDM8531334.1 rod shape-determining protein MreD [Anaerolineales bacterium HSG25]